MRIEIIAIGDEVLAGITVNSNASFLSRLLLDHGFQVDLHTAVADEEKALSCVITEALLRKSIVILTGGLGPTIDDHTRQVVASVFNVPLEYSEERFQANLSRFGNIEKNRESLINQALLPQGATPIENGVGSAYGFVMRDEALFPGSVIIAFPGVPTELRQMASESLIQHIKTKDQKRFFIEPLYFLRIEEPEVDLLLQQLQVKYSHIQFGIYPGYGVIDVHLKAEADSETAFQQLIQEAKKELLEQFGKYYCKKPLEESLHELLLSSHLTLTTAESCTGGAIASEIVARSGVSHYFRGGVVAYCDEIKQQVLNVPSSLLAEKGAVSVEVTQALAEGASALMKCDIAIAVSGILGPTGGSSEKPVGLVCATIAMKGKPSFSWSVVHRGGRKAVCARAVGNILSELFLYLKTHMR